MLEFKKKVWAEYPIPFTISIWGGDGIEQHPVADLDALIESCISELRSDVYITDFVEAAGMQTRLPDDAFAVSYAQLKFPFAGNRLVKVQFDVAMKMAITRYPPCTIYYRRYLSKENVDKLQGDFLMYAKAYTLWKMADKEINMLRSMILDPDNAQINLDALAKFAESCQKRYEDMKPEIMLYPPGM